MYKDKDEVYVSGSVKRSGRIYQFVNPHMEKQGKQHTGLNPVYSLTAGLTQKTMRIAVKSAVDTVYGKLKDIFPNEFRSKYKLAELNFSLLNVHRITSYNVCYTKLLRKNPKQTACFATN